MRVPAWVSDAAGVGAESAVRGLHSVTMTVRNPEPSVAFMRDLGFAIVNETEGRLRVAVNGPGAGRTIDIVSSPNRPSGGAMVSERYHVAMAIGDASDQLRLREELVRRGIEVTPVMDRQYFQSIYFREPGGVLFEVATTARVRHRRAGR